MGVAISAAALWWVSRDVTWSELLLRLQRFPVWTLVTYAFLQLVLQAFRVLRWWLMVREVGGRSFRATVVAANIGIPATVFLPLRLGEWVRPALISRQGVPFGSALATILVERLVDAILCVGVFFCLFPFVPATQGLSGVVQALAAVGGALFALGLGLVIAAWFAREPIVRWVSWMLGPFPKRLSARLIQLLTDFLDGLKRIGTGRRLLLYLAVTLTYWLVGWLATDLLIRQSLSGMAWYVAPFTVSAVVFAMLVPAPANAGTLEAGFRFGLGAFHVEPASALAIALVSHVTQLLMFGVVWVVGMSMAPVPAGIPARDA